MSRKRGNRGDRRVQFIQNNLELLGFGNPRDALIQTVKELFENALDAVIAGAEASSWDGETQELLRIRVQLNATTGLVDIVCADTGTGICAHKITQLCCGGFETSKTQVGTMGGVVCGKYGVGLKAAVLHSQQHCPGSQLTIVTTSTASEILYMQLRIDPRSEDSAIVRELLQYQLDDECQNFTGTEMRISTPCPTSSGDIEYAADILALYFQSLRYAVPSFICADFSMDIGHVSTQFECTGGCEPLDRFTGDFNVTIDELVHFKQGTPTHTVNSMALVHCANEDSGPRVMEITVLRYANHVPLLNANDFFLCAIAQGIETSRSWKEYGYNCLQSGSHLINQLVATPKTHRGIPCRSTSGEPLRLILAIDISQDDQQSDASIKYASMRKTALDKSYLKDVQVSCRAILRQLHARGFLVTPQQGRDEDLVERYAPQIASAATSILNRSNSLLLSFNADTGVSTNEDDSAFDTNVVTILLQRVLHHDIFKTTPHV